MAGGRIMGTRMTGRKFSQRRPIGGIVDHFVEVEHHQLHSTKGWRRVKRFIHELPKDAVDVPAWQEHFVPADDLPVRTGGGKGIDSGPSEPGRWMRRRVAKPGPVRLTPHDWWRRETFGSSRRIKNMTDAERTRAHKLMEEARAKLR